MSKERLLSTLALVRSGIEFGAKEWNLRALTEDGDGSEKVVELAASLMKDVHELSAELTKGALTMFSDSARADFVCPMSLSQTDFAAVAFPTFSMRLAPGTGTRATDEDGIVVTALVRNLLPTVSPETLLPPASLLTLQV